MGYSWDELYPSLKLLYIAYKNRCGINIREVLSKNKDMNYHQAYDRLSRMARNGLFVIEKLPREPTGGRHPILFVISRNGLKKVQALKNRGVYQEVYDDKYWRMW